MEAKNSKGWDLIRVLAFTHVSTSTFLSEVVSAGEGRFTTFNNHAHFLLCFCRYMVKNVISKNAFTKKADCDIFR